MMPKPGKTRLIDTARVIRSKNAGPFELTFDILFREKSHFTTFRECNVLTPKTIATLFRIRESDICSIVYYDPVHAVKFTIRRARPSGDPGDSDIYGAQQHAPLLDLEW